jgi:hypothetical protein
MPGARKQSAPPPLNIPAASLLSQHFSGPGEAQSPASLALVTSLFIPGLGCVEYPLGIPKEALLSPSFIYNALSSSGQYEEEAQFHLHVSTPK